jgi:hypothetical protein
MAKENPFLKLLQNKPATQPTPKEEAEPKVESKPASTSTSTSTATATANPLTSLLAAQPEPESNDNDDKPVESIHELARLNTESFEPQQTRVQALPAVAAARAKKLVLDSKEDVRALCDRVDAMIESNEQLAGPRLGELRMYVQQLSVTLKERPEFDGVIIDKDIRNIIKFIRATREETLLLRDIKIEKKTTRAAKKEKQLTLDKNFAAAFKNALNAKNLKL